MTQMSRSGREPTPGVDAAPAVETGEADAAVEPAENCSTSCGTIAIRATRTRPNPSALNALCRRPQRATAAPGEDQGHDAEQDPECLGRPAGKRSAGCKDDDMPVAEEEGDEGRKQDCCAGRIPQHHCTRQQQRRGDSNDDEQHRQDLSEVRLAQVRGVEEEDCVAGKQQRMDRKRLAGEKREIDVTDEFGTRMTMLAPRHDTRIGDRRLAALLSPVALGPSGGSAAWR